MNAQGRTGSVADERAHAQTAEDRTENVTSTGNSIVSSLIMFVLIFGLFLAGLYVLSLFTLWTMVIGTMMCIIALYLAFDLVPALLT